MVLEVMNNTSKMGSTDGAPSNKRKADDSEDQPPHKTKFLSSIL